METYSSSSMFEVNNLLHHYCRFLYQTESIICMEDNIDKINDKKTLYIKICKEFLRESKYKENKIRFIRENFMLPIIIPESYRCDSNSNVIIYNAMVPRTTLREVLYGSNTDEKIRYLKLVKETLFKLHKEGIINTNFDIDNIYVRQEKKHDRMIEEIYFIIDNCIVPRLGFDINTTDFFYYDFIKNNGDVGNYDFHLYNILVWQVINDYNNPYLFNYRFDRDNKNNFIYSKFKSEENIKILQKMRNCEISGLLIDNLSKGIY